MYSRIINSIQNGTFFKKVKSRMIKNISVYLIVPIVRLFKKTKENQILFLTFQGPYTCNPKSIADEIIKQKLPYRLVWTCRLSNLEKKEQGWRYHIH